MPDVLHTFRPGHRIMVQVQSTWFPLCDRNPQTFCNIYECDESAFKKQTHRVYRDAEHPSRVSGVIVIGPALRERVREIQAIGASQLEWKA